MTSKPWMPLYIADYLADTSHLGALQSGAYLHLIMHYWQHGALPTNDAALSRIARLTPAEWRRERPTISAFFVEHWRHKRIDAELAHAAEVSSKRSASAKQKYGKRDASAEQLQEQKQPHAGATSQSQTSPPVVPVPETGVIFPNTAPSQASGAAGDDSFRGQDEAETFAAVGLENDSHHIGDATEMVLPEEPVPDEIPAVLDRRRYPEAFEELWLAYRPIASPNATKADACTAWKRLSAADRAACLVGLRAYVAWLQAERRKRADAPAKHLSTFINRRGWETAGEGTAAPAGGGVETTWVLVECPDWARCEAHYRAEHGGRPPPRTSGLGGMGWRFPTTWLEQEAA